MRILIAFAMLCSFATHAQHDLTGTVFSTTASPITYATVVLFEETTNAFYKSTVTDEFGKFAIPQVASGTYVLEIRSLGYVTLSRKLTLNNPTALEKIILENAIDELNAVTVNAKKPVITRTADRVVFNVENSSLSNGNALNIIKSTPGVVAFNGNYLVQNKKAVVYINDVRVHLTAGELEALLTGYSGDNIKAVEVITAPPAQYDADGAVVINIKTNKSLTPGYKGTVTTDYTIDTFAKYQLGTSHFYKNDRWNIYANYNYNPRKDFKEDEAQIGFFNADGTRNSRWFVDFDKVYEQAPHTFNTAIDFTINDANIIDMAGNLLVNQDQAIQTNSQTLILEQNATAFSGFNTNSALAGNRLQGFINGGWKHIFNDKNSFRVEGNYIVTDRDVSQNLNSRFFDVNNAFTRANAFTTQQDQRIVITSGLFNYMYKSDDFNLTTGVKYTHVDNRSILDFFDQNSGSPVFNSTLSDDFDYDESVYAAFAQFDKSWAAWSLNAGLRVEQTDVIGDSRALGLVNTQNYLEIFPTLAISKQQNENNVYALSYKRSIERPPYELLNPFSYFINDNNFTTGNPNLTPAFTNSYNLSWSYKDFFNLVGAYTYTRDLLATQPIQDNTNFTVNTQGDNLNYELQYALDASFYKQVNDSWFTQNYLSVYYMENEFIARGTGNVVTQNNTTGFYLSTFNRFNLSKDGTLNLDMQAGYLSSLVIGSYEFRNQLTTSVGLYKSLWNDRATLTVNLNDLFLTQNQALRSRYLNQDNQFLALPETQTFNIGFTYKFGNFRLENREVKDPEEKERTNSKTF